jgi:hypothetical protein
MRCRLTAVVLLAALPLVGCGGGGGEQAASTSGAAAHVVADACGTSGTHHSHLRQRCERGGEQEHVEKPVRKPDAATAAATCASPATVEAYAQDDWIGLAQSLAAAPEGCLEAWISVPTESGPDGAWLTTRPGMKERFAKIGADVHPMPEVNFNDWNAWGKDHPGVSWLERGQRARAEMEQAGYDFDKGDRWALNEIPIAALGSAADRDAVRDFAKGLQGDSATPTGVVYVVMHQQGDPMNEAELKTWFADEAFWREMERAASSWSVEAYANVRDTCEPGASASAQVDALRAYAFSREEYAKRLSLGDDASVSKVLGRGVPLVNGAWSWPDAYGFTAVEPSVMEDFVALQIAAVARSLPGGDAPTVGFAWAPKRPDGVGDAAYRRDLAGVAAAIRDAVVNANREGGAAAAKGCSYPGAKLVSG